MVKPSKRHKRRQVDICLPQVVKRHDEVQDVLLSNRATIMNSGNKSVSIATIFNGTADCLTSMNKFYVCGSFVAVAAFFASLELSRMSRLLESIKKMRN